MKNPFNKIRTVRKPEKLNPENPAQRKQLIEQAVKRTLSEYGEALKKLGAE